MVERAEARQVLAAGRRLRDAAERVADGDRHIRGEARDAYLREREQLLARHLETLPVSALRDAGGTKVRTGPLEKAGLTTVGAVRALPESRLAALPGLSAAGARLVKATADQVAEAAERSLAVRVNFDPKDRAATSLLTAVHRVLRGATALLATSKAWGWLAGRDYVTPDDVKQVARATLRHRVRLRPEAELEGVTTDAVLESVLASVPAPR